MKSHLLGLRWILGIEKQIMREELLIEGSVQGVGYRYTVSRIADDIGVTGWVRNLPDGRVQVLCEGTREKLDEFRERIKIVGKLINVTRITATSSEEVRQRLYSGFLVAQRS